MPDPASSISALVGDTITQVDGATVGGGEVRIVTDRGTLRLYHQDDCCESVEIADVTGDPADLVGGVVIVAEERVSDPPADADTLRDPDFIDSETWTFYEIRTTRGDLTIRWLGRSNGYYSESVDSEWMPS